MGSVILDHFGLPGGSVGSLLDSCAANVPYLPRVPSIAARAGIVLRALEFIQIANFVRFAHMLFVRLFFTCALRTLRLAGRWFGDYNRCLSMDVSSGSLSRQPRRGQGSSNFHVSGLSAPRPDPRELGREIRAAREGLRWTQEELAEKAGVGVNTVKNVEAGRINRTTRTQSFIITAVNKGYGGAYSWSWIRQPGMAPRGAVTICYDAEDGTGKGCVFKHETPLQREIYLRLKLENASELWLDGLLADLAGLWFRTDSKCSWQILAASPHALNWEFSHGQPRNLDPRGYRYLDLVTFRDGLEGFDIMIARPRGERIYWQDQLRRPGFYLLKVRIQPRDCRESLASYVFHWKGSIDLFDPHDLRLAWPSESPSE